MFFLVGIALFFSQFLVYGICKFLKEKLNRWVALGYTILNVILAFPIGIVVLFLGVMGTDSGTREAEMSAMAFMGISALLYLGTFILSLMITIGSFKAHNQKEPEENDQ